MHTDSPHRIAANQKLSGLGKKFFHYIEFDDSEELVLEIRKHPFGLFVIEFSGFLISILLTGLLVGLAFMVDDTNVVDGTSTPLVQNIMVIVGVVLGILGIGATFISALIYKNNVIFVTNEKIAQVLYTNLIDRKISQLSIGDVQDVTVTQRGLFSRIFKYGTLVIETAGEQQNYSFNYVPDPYGCARTIVGAHESNLKEYGN